MPTESKPVAFYDTVINTTDANGKTQTTVVDTDFWATTLDQLEAVTSFEERIHKVGAISYYGRVELPRRPATRHLQIGRLRNLSDHLEQTNLADGEVSTLVLADPNLRVSEPTFLVPFGALGKVAIMSPGRSTRQETVGNWLTGVLDLAKDGKSIWFRPVIDEDALERLLASSGATSVEFTVDADNELNLDGTKATKGDKSFFEAVNGVQDAGPSTGTVTMRWSLGRDGGTGRDRNFIKSLATRIATGGFANSGSVNMILEDEAGKTHHETHKLIEDLIVTKAKWSVQSDRATTTQVILEAINGAIAEFNAR